MGVAETKEALRVEVSKVCRNYCLQVWNEALNQAEVEAFSALRRAESVYYPPATRTPGSASSKADTALEWQSLERTARPRSLSFLIALPRRPSSAGLLKKKLTQPREWPLMPSSPQLLLRTYPKRKRYPPRWRLSWQLSLCLPRGTSRVRAQKPQRQHSPSPPRPQPKMKL